MAVVGRVEGECLSDRWCSGRKTGDEEKRRGTKEEGLEDEDRD